jgi:hypothetical protein
MPEWFKVILKILAVPVILLFVMFIITIATTYKYMEFKNIISYEGNYDIYEAYYDEYCVNDVQIFPRVYVKDGRIGSYGVFAGMQSKTEDCKASVNGVTARLYMKNGECKQLNVTLEDTDLYEFNQSRGKYVNYDYLCTFSIDYADVSLSDVEKLELSVDLTVENNGVTERGIVNNTYIPIIEKSDSITDWLLCV